MIGKTFSHYKILEKLGAGGMGEVYFAEDLKLERKVAIKFLPPYLTQDKEHVERFEREAKAAAALNHPNIITIYDVIETDGSATADRQICIVMEYVDGESLRTKLDKGKIDVDEVMKITKQICEGLSKAHQAEIIHRDIKPENILINTDGRVKILDFGLAKLKGVSKLTKETSTLGTIHYMSPEQIQGKDVDHRSDIWSLGVVLYEMLTGETPFAGDYEQAISYAILNEEPKLVESIPSGLQNIMKRALNKNPDQRFQNLNELISECNEIQNTSNINQPDEEITSKAGKHINLRTSIISIIIVVAIIISYLVYYSRINDDIEQFRVKRLVVLPFENLGSSEDEYFADGITEEITSRLSLLHGLGVISRSSAIQYKNTDKTVRQIGEELDIDYILEGTIRWDKSIGSKGRVIVTPQLISVSDDIHIWSDSYDRMLEDIFNVQAGIAEEVIKALDIKVLEPEREELYHHPTDNLEAYDLFIRARQIRQKYLYTEPAKLDSAIQLFEQAIKIDENLVMAYVWISEIHSWLYHIRFDYTENRQAKAKAFIERALEIQPDSPEAKLYKGWYYYAVFKDYERAKELINEVKKQRPNQSPEILAYIERRQNNWENAVLHLKEAFKLDPRTPGNALELGTTYMCIRKYEDAESWLNRYQVMEPSDVSSISKLAQCYILADGNINDAQSALSSIKKINECNGEVLTTLILIELFKKNYNQVLNLFDSLGINAIDTQQLFMDKYCVKAYVHHLLGDGLKCRLYADSSVMVINDEMKKNSNDPRYHSALGITYAFQGKKNEAISAAIRAMDIYPVSLDAFDGPNYVYNLAWVYSIIGEYDNAIEQLEYLLSIEAGEFVSKPMLKIDPKWNKLRDRPKFQKLIEYFQGEIKKD
jgi:serine/threonine protein kinase/Flp pilus assembly protein TadD